MFPVIEKIEVVKGFRYLWLKYVEGANLEEHCAKSLIGEYSQKIKHTTKQDSEIVLDENVSPYYYLCGVSSPYKWLNNFHLAFRYKADSMIEISENGITIKIRDAEIIKIESYMMRERNHPNIIKREFFTCRNWVFANMIAEEFNAKD